MAALIELNNICGGYDKKRVINNVSFEVERGEFLGIIGPNGSGKSTLLRLMSRALSPQEGAVNIQGRDISKMDMKELCRKIAFVPQETLINFSFSVEEIVLMGRIPYLKRMQSESRKDFLMVENALLSTDALALKESYIDELSAGERQLVLIARCLAQEAAVLFLDEPTSHLDIGHQIQILNLLKNLNQENNLTIIIVLHDLNLAAEYCQRLILINHGSIFKDGSPAEVLTYQNIEKVYKTVVVVEKNPISSRPYIIPFCGEKK